MDGNKTTLLLQAAASPRIPPPSAAAYAAAPPSPSAHIELRNRRCRYAIASLLRRARVRRDVRRRRGQSAGDYLLWCADRLSVTESGVESRDVAERHTPATRFSCLANSAQNITRRNGHTHLLRCRRRFRPAFVAPGQRISLAATHCGIARCVVTRHL
jgi:hypothetical protein